MKVLVAAVLLHGALAAQRFTAGQLFRGFIRDFNKTYVDEAATTLAFQTFKTNLAEIRKLNQMEGDVVFGVGPFTDMSEEEFARTHRNFIPGERSEEELANVMTPPEGFTAPDSFDWRDHNAVTPVKDQGQCGSCWAFSITEEVESTWILAGNPMTEFAPQAIVSCDKKDAGCNGGDTIEGYKFVEKNGGLPLEKNDPYSSGTTGRTGRCKKVAVAGGDISAFKYATPGCAKDPRCTKQNEDTLKANLSSSAPVSICVNAAKWQHYKRGIFTSRHCGTDDYNKLDHCVQLTGYDTSGSDGYWSVRNSWTTSWGEKGYIRLAYGTNTCGVADEATITEIKK